MLGKYCHECGQLEKNLYRPLSEILFESLSNFIAFDTRFFRTVGPLLFQPGRVPREFMDGRRVRYTPPVQLFFFSSIVLFLLLGFLSQLTRDSDSAPAGEAPPVLLSPLPGPLTSSPTTADDAEILSWQFPDKPEQSTAKQAKSIPDFSPLKKTDVSYLPDPLRHWVERELHRADSKYRRLRENPQALAALILRHLPLALFLMVPLVALLLKLFYPLSGRYYTEHLIHVLYLHGFFFLWMAIANGFVLFNLLARAGNPTGAIGTILTVLFWLWVPVYVFWSLRRFYAQGWWLTSWKFVLVIAGYLTMLAAVISVVIIISLLQF